MQVLKNRDRRDTGYKLYFFDIKAPAKEPKFYKTVLDIISNKIIFVIVITLVLFPFFQNKMDICVFSRMQHYVMVFFSYTHEGLTMKRLCEYNNIGIK